MRRDELNDLAAFVAVAEARSFARAAVTLGISASALSHAIKGLEARLGLVLLARTTRKVATTEAGERLLRTARPAFDGIERELEALRAMRDTPSGRLRLTTFKHAATSVIMPALPRFLDAYPEVQLEVVVEDGHVDIVAERFDAGIRFGESIAKDMTSIKVAPGFRAVVVGAPHYFMDHAKPRHPRELSHHLCIVHNIADGRAGSGWMFQDKARPFSVHVEGPLVFNDIELVLSAAVAGYGLAYLLEDQVSFHLQSGALCAVLASWAPHSVGYYLYHPSANAPSPALTAFIRTLNQGPARSVASAGSESRRPRRLPSQPSETLAHE